MRRELRARIVLVTGASRGIGRRVAQQLAARGAKLALTARSADELAKVASECRAAGAEVETFPADLTSPEDRERIVAGTVARFGGLDVLVNCAGVGAFGEFTTSTEETVRRSMEVNFFAQAEMIRVCLPHLTRSGDTARDGFRPAILNVASICGRWGIPSMPEHCASKHALVGLTEALRAEFTRFGIDVLLVLPGVVRSDDIDRHMLRNDGKIYLDFDGAQPPEEVAEVVVRSLIKNHTERTAGFVSWVVWLARRYAPRMLRLFMHMKVRKYARREKARQTQPPL
jgi:short-subunit dehydrogenase